MQHADSDATELAGNSPSASARPLTVALVGNPNTGKSTLFVDLAGVRQHVGNYPGVTVEKKIGRTEIEGRVVDLVDLPGTYSLAPRSLDEMVTVDVLLGRRADVPPIDCVVVIVDASNLERNLYLLSQVLELQTPVVVALNMTDIAKSRGIVLDVARLRNQLGVPVVEIQANRRIGLPELKRAISQAAEHPLPAMQSPFSPEFQREVAVLKTAADTAGVPMPRYLLERLLLDVGGYLQERLSSNGAVPLMPHVEAGRGRLREAGTPVPAVEAIARYGWVSRVLDGIVSRPKERVTTASDQLDRLLTHRVWGTLLFALAMLVIFSSVFVFADPLMGFIDSGVGWLGEQIGSRMNEGALQSLVVDGIIGGVGSVVIFLPQILILFLFIGVLEDCGYMARAAYLMDKLMSRIGLSGKSFIPLLSSFACAVPGIMATRVIENRRDRLTTILIAPLMSCSARLPVYAILIAAFIPDRAYAGGLVQLQGVTMFAMYLVGMMAATVVALILKRTLLKGPTPPFVMELPSYKWPSPSIVLSRMIERGWAFIQRAGTLIMAVSIIVWAAGYYPHDQAAIEGPYRLEREKLATERDQTRDEGKRQQLDEQLTEIDREIVAEYQRRSWLGQAGQWIEPAVKPLGWDWRIGCAAIASFPAREVVMGVLGVIYHLGSDLDVGEASDQHRLAARLQAARWDGTDIPVYNVPVALSIMVFFALCAQCASTLAVIKRETNSWRWPVFAFVYMTVLAYVGALVTYQTGMWLAHLG